MIRRKSSALLQPPPIQRVPEDPLASRVRALDRDTGSLVEALPYWEIFRDLVFLADGRVEFGFRLSPLNAEAMDEGSMGLLHRGIRAILRQGMEDGLRIRLYAEVRQGEIPEKEAYLGLKTAPEAILDYMGTRGYEELSAWERRGELYSYAYYLSAEYGEPRKGYRTGNALLAFFQDLIPATKGGRYITFTLEEMEDLLQRAEAARSRLSQQLSLAGIPHTRLGTNELFSLAYRYLNPGAPALTSYQPAFEYLPQELTQKLEEARRPTLRSRLVRSTLDNRHLHFLRVGDYYLSAVKLVEVPAETWMGMFHRLLGRGGKPKWFILDFVRMPMARAEGILRNRFRDYWRTAEQSDIPDIGAQEGAREVAEYIQHIRRNAEGIYLVGGVFYLLAPTLEELEERTRDLLVGASEIEGQPFMRMRRGVFSVFLEGLPLSGQRFSRPRMYPETQAAHLWVWAGPWQHHAKRPVELYLTRYNTPVSLDPWDSRLPNYNALIVGETGSGKSFLVQHRLTEVLKMKDVVAVAIDRHEYSYDGLYHALHEEGVAEKIHFGPNSGTCINPFDLPEGQHEPDDLKLLQLEALFRLMAPPGGEYDPAHEEAILRSAILQTYGNATTEVETPTGWERRYTGATISDLIKSLRNLNKVADHLPSPKEREIADSLAARLEKWSRKTSLGKLFDGPSTARISPRTRFLYVIAEEVEGMEEFRQISMLALVQLVWSHILRSPFPHRVVVIEEAWHLLKNPHSANVVYELFRRGRTLGVSTWAVSQSLEDFLSEHGKAIANNAARFFIMRNSTPAEKVAEVLGCPVPLAEEKDTLQRSLKRFSKVLVWTRYGEGGEGGVVRVLADPVRYWTFTTHPLEREQRRSLAQKLGSTLKAIQELARGEP